MKKLFILLFTVICITMSSSIFAYAAPTPSALKYRSHVAELGWLPYVRDGETTGTTGKGIRMEAVDIQITYGGISGIRFRVHAADLGWMPWKSSGQMAGTTGQSRQLEAIQIQLENGMEDLYDVYYRVHVESDGWKSWMKNGEIAGTVGQGKRMEALQIRIASKETQIGRDGTITYVKNENKSGWQYPVSNAYCTWSNKSNMSWSGYSYSSSRSSRTDHAGIDIASSSGDKNIYAASSGTVAKVGYNGANGNYVILKHNLSGKTVYSFYAHLSSYCVRNGQTVDKGSKIGIIGNTGSSSFGTHLHFAVVDTLWSGSYYGYIPGFVGDKATYSGVTYYNPLYIIQHNRLP